MTVPPEVDRLRQINWFPITIAALLAGLALIAVGHALVTGVRRRRRDLALLKTLGFTRWEIHVYQMASWCMAVYFRGLTGRETHSLTDAMIRSGETIDLHGALGRKVVDKHSTGGVGDKTSLAVGPIVPADPTDLLVTLDAEDAFDVQAGLPRVTAPTLVIGGGNDHFYTPELFHGTAAGVQDGRVHIFPGWGHLRASGSTATAHLTLGFLLAGIPTRPGH